MTRRRRPVLDVRIRFGNAAMLTPPDAADALADVVNRLRSMGDVDLTEHRTLSIDRPILDANGNAVGRVTLRHRTLKED